jgi:hypothetical protein
MRRLPDLLSFTMRHLAMFLVILLAGQIAIAQKTDRRFHADAFASMSGMTLTGAPKTDLTTPINDVSFRYEFNGMWTSKKDSAWGSPGAFGGGVGIMRWGAETVYPVYFQMSLQPFKPLKKLRLDGRIGTTLGPWKESAEGHVNLTLYSEIGLRYSLLAKPKWNAILRLHFGFLDPSGPLHVYEEGQWHDAKNFSFVYVGFGLGVSF